jgi:subtilisin family serine protease
MKAVFGLAFLLFANCLFGQNDISLPFEDEGPTATEGKYRASNTYLVKPKNRGQLEKLLNSEDSYFCENLNWVVVKAPSKPVSLLDQSELIELDSRIELNLLPNDPLLQNQWAWSKIDAFNAWNFTVGNQDVIVGVIDTGIDYNHPDLIQNMWVGPNGETGWQVINGSLSVGGMDDHGHGTHVAGTIGAAANNGVGVSGVNWSVKLIPFKFLDSNGQGQTSDAIILIDKILSLKRAGLNIRVLNNSWGGPGYLKSLEEAFKALEDEGILNVCAAGNNRNDGDLYEGSYPSNYENRGIISIVASDELDAKSSFSNYGLADTDISAPGSNIYSTVPLIGRVSDPTGYKYLNGTSMASPHVAGLAALILSTHPNLTVYELRDLICDPASYDFVNHVSSTGGRINLLKTLENPKVAGGFVLNSFPNIAFNNTEPLRLLSGSEFIYDVAFSDADQDSLLNRTNYKLDIWDGWTVTQILRETLPYISSFPMLYKVPQFSRDCYIDISSSVSDKRGGSSRRSFGLNAIRNPSFINLPPVGQIILPKTDVDVGETLTATFSFSDPENDYVLAGLDLSWTNRQTRYARVSNNSTWTIPTESATVVRIKLTILDSALNSTEVTAEVRVGGASTLPLIVNHSIDKTSGYAPLTVTIDFSHTEGTYPFFTYLFNWAWVRTNKYQFTFSQPGNYMIPIGGMDGKNHYYTRDVIFTVLKPDGIIEPPPPPPPPPTINNPSGLSANLIGANQIKLVWTDNSTNEAEFVVERSLNATDYSTLVVLPQNSTSYTNTGLSFDTLYYYRVKARVELLQSGYSNVASTRTSAAPQLVKVTDLSGTLGGRTAVIRWTDTSFNEEKWEVYVGKFSARGKGSYSLVGTLGQNSTSFVYSLPSLRFEYRFYVKSCAAGACSENSNIIILNDLP